MAEDWSFLDAVVAGVFTLPGDGMVDFVAVLRDLTGCNHCLVVEAGQDSVKAAALWYPRMGCENLRRFAAEPVVRGMGKQGALHGIASGLRMGWEEFRQWALEKGIRAECVAGAHGSGSSAPQPGQAQCRPGAEGGYPSCGIAVSGLYRRDDDRGWRGHGL
jgi:hypothetical protein